MLSLADGVFTQEWQFTTTALILSVLLYAAVVFAMSPAGSRNPVVKLVFAIYDSICQWLVCWDLMPKSAGGDRYFKDNWKFMSIKPRTPRQASKSSPGQQKNSPHRGNQYSKSYSGRMAPRVDGFDFSRVNDTALRIRDPTWVTATSTVDSNSGHRLTPHAINRQLMTCNTLRDLFRLVELHFEAFDFVNMVTVVYRCSKGNPTLVRKFFSKFSDENAKFDQPLTEFPLFIELLDKIADHLRQGKSNPRSLANLVWSLAKLGVKVDDQKILIPIQNLVKEQVKEFKLQELSNIAWGTSTMMLSSSEIATWPSTNGVFTAVAQEGCLRLNEFCDQEVANLCWAFVRAFVTGVPQNDDTTRFLSALADVVIKREGFFQSQQLSMISWAFAKANCLPYKLQVELLRSIASVTCGDRVRKWKPQEMASVVWSFAKCDVQQNFDKFSFIQAGRAIAQECLRRNFASFKGQDFSNICWSLSVLGVVNDHFGDCLVPVAISRMNRFKPYELSSVCAALAQRCDPTPASTMELLNKANEHISTIYLDATSPQTISNFAFAFGRCNISCPLLLPHALNRLKNAPEGETCPFAPEEIATMTWAFCLMAHALDEDQEKQLHEFLTYMEKALIGEMKSLRVTELCHVLCEPLRVDADVSPLLKAAEEAITDALFETTIDEVCRQGT